MALVEAAEAERSARTSIRSEARWSDHVITMLTGVWILVGMALDAAVHNNSTSQVESFFTPWHALLYSGFLASVAWMGVLAARHRGLGPGGRGLLGALPRGHGVTAVGLLLFALSGLGDMLWHTVYGFEKGSEALISPPHAGLFVGTLLVLSTPFRVAWSAAGGRRPSLAAFLPVLLSLTFSVLVLTFALQWLWPFYYDQHRWRLWFVWLLQDVALPSTPVAVALSEITMHAGLSHILAANLLLMGAILLMLRRWHPPFGSLTIFLAMAVGPGTRFELVPAGLLAGLAADGLVAALRPSPERVWAFRAFAFITPILVWGLYFAAVLGRWALAWPPTAYVGVMLWGALSALGLSVVMVPARLPDSPGSEVQVVRSADRQ